MEKDAKIYVAGARGLVGSAIVRRLTSEGYQNLVTPSSKELNLIDQLATRQFFLTEKPDYVFDAAAKVGGIMANSKYQADFLYQNLQIQTNLIRFAHEAKVKKLLFLGSSCIYPREAQQPIKEEYWLTGKFEPTNEAYAMAKSSGIMMCDKYREQYGADFISAMPTNIYGIGDNFHPENSHLVPAIMRRMHEAKETGAKSVVIWGTGKPMRELLFSEDLADACFFLMNNYSDYGHINVGTGQDLTIKEIAETIREVVGFDGQLEYDTSKPDGMPRKVMDVSKLTALGWQAKTSLREGLTIMYNWYLANKDQVREK